MEGTLRYDHYKVLDVPRDATPDRIKRAYRERVKDWHPDRNPSPKAAAVFQAVHEAYSVLSDADLRQRYDERLQFYRQATPTEATAPKRDHYPFSGGRSAGNGERDRPVNRFAFYGLHLTGLLFGVTLVMGILIGVTFWDWPMYILFFTAPGLAVIPDSWEGLKS
ncbi:MAG: J domain-containing protein [Flavobacteriales bacterium]